MNTSAERKISTSPLRAACSLSPQRDLPPTVELEKNDTPGNRAQHRRQATDETPSRAVGFCVGWQPKPQQKAPPVGSGAKFGPSTCTFGLAPSGLSKAANPPTNTEPHFWLHRPATEKARRSGAKFSIEKVGLLSNRTSAKGQARRGGWQLVAVSAFRPSPHVKAPPKRGQANHKGLREMQEKANPPSNDSPR